jgi:hypothetical protein
VPHEEVQNQENWLNRACGSPESLSQAVQPNRPYGVPRIAGRSSLRRLPLRSEVDHGNLERSRVIIWPSFCANLIHHRFCCFALFFCGIEGFFAVRACG